MHLQLCVPRVNTAELSLTWEKWTKGVPHPHLYVCVLLGFEPGVLYVLGERFNHSTTTQVLNSSDFLLPSTCCL